MHNHLNHAQNIYTQHKNMLLDILIVLITYEGVTHVAIMGKSHTYTITNILS